MAMTDPPFVMFSVPVPLPDVYTLLRSQVRASAVNRRQPVTSDS